MSDNQKPYPFSVCIKCCSGGTDIEPSAVVSDAFFVAESDGTYKLNVLKLDGSGSFDPATIPSKEYVDNKTSETSPGGAITVDDYLDTIDLTSENPVQNKVIAAKIAYLDDITKMNMEGINNAINGVRQEGNTLYFDTPNLPGAALAVVATPTYVDNAIGDIETALDNIIAIQNSLIGGDSE